MSILRHVDFNPPDWGEFGGQPPAVDRAHRHALLAQRPLAFWPLDEAPGSLSLKDAQRGQHHATPSGSINPGSGPSPLIHDPATATEFSGGWLELPSLAQFGTQLSEGFAFACWLRTSTLQSATLISAANPYPGSSLSFQLNRGRFGQVAPGRLRCFLRTSADGSLRADADMNGLHLDDAWHHLAMAYHPATTEVLFFLDGQLLPTTYADRTAPVSGTPFVVPVAIGALSNSSGFSDPYIGRMCHASLFERPLSASSIAALYLAGTGPLAATLSQSESAAYPDAPAGTPLGVQGTIGSGSAGMFRSIELSSPTDATHTRIAVRSESLSTGSVTLLRAVDQADRPVAWVRCVENQTVSLHTHDEDASPVALPTPLPWHSIELATHVASNSASLHVNGWPAATLQVPEGDSVSRLDAGVMDCRLASGRLDLDDWVAADAPIGPPVLAPSSDAPDDPARWLVLYHRDQPESIAWVDAYRQARGVPLGNLFGLSTASEEIVSPTVYDELRAEIDARLAQGTLADQLVGILLGPGLPGLVDVNGDATRAWPVVAGLQANTPATQLTPNPLGTGPLERPSVGNLAGRLLASRIDGDTTLCNELTTRGLAIAASILQSSDARLYVDPYGDPAADSTHNAPVAEWVKSVDAQSLGMDIQSTSQDQRSFGGIEQDAVYFGYEAGAPASDFFGTSAARAVFVQGEFLQPPWQTLRAERSSHWPGAALDAGYAITLTATSTYSPSHAVDVGRFFAALSQGWTVAEAWHVAQPFLGTPFQLIGDPLATIGFPKAGYRVYGPAPSLQQAIAEPASAFARLGSAVWTPPEKWLAAGEMGVAVLVSLDAEGRENRSIDAVRMVGRGERVGRLPLNPVWPGRTGWPVANGHVARIVWDRRPIDCGVATIRLEQEEAGGAQGVVAEIDSANIRAHHLDVKVDAPSTASRWRWVLVNPENNTVTSPWSAWMLAEASTPTGPELESNL